MSGPRPGAQARLPSNPTVLGLDFGTEAARAVLVDAGSGRVLHSCSVRYADSEAAPSLPRDPLCPLPQDYEWALWTLLEYGVPEPWRSTLAGLCVDATSFTMIPLAADGRALCELPRFSGQPHARGKLWKYHGAQPQAEEALALAQQRGEAFLGRTGGSLSCEWALPKLMEVRDKAGAVYAALDLALDLCEFLTLRLTGRLARSMGSLCYKGLWSRDLGFPRDGYLNALRPGLAGEYRRQMRGPVLRPGERAGWLRPELCARFHLRQGIPVASGVLDGHTAFAALGAFQPNDAALVVGTSNVLTVQCAQLFEPQGICGIALDGQMPGLYGIDAGQNCTGDLLAWYLRSMAPGPVLEQAAQRGISPHQLLAQQVTAPWENQLIAVDWWNGSRCAPCDLTLRGAVQGFSLQTRPQDLYLALLQSIVCGTREILDSLRGQGIPVRRLVAAGGAANKNPLLMQEYANLLHQPVQVGSVAEGPALGAALFAAAAGVYDTLPQAWAQMGVRQFITYTPDTAHREAYEALYQRAHALRKTLSDK